MATKRRKEATEQTAPDPAAEAPSGAGTGLEPRVTSAASIGASWQWLFWAAVGIVVVFVVFAVALFVRADDNLRETDWSRSVYVLLGVEAIAFTAVGWLFGREVHRGEAQAAAETADYAQQDAARAKDEAEEQRTKVDSAKERESDARERAVAAETKGRALAEAVRASGEATLETGGNERSPAGPLVGGAPSESLRVLADRLFPPD